MMYRTIKLIASFAVGYCAAGYALYGHRSSLAIVLVCLSILVNLGSTDPDAHTR
jgi:hypothetical protein